MVLLFMARTVSGRKAMIEIYGKPNCGFCDMSVEIAERYNLEYEYKDATDLEIYSQLLEKIGSVPSVPQIFWNSNHIGGYESFVAEIENTREFGQGGF